MKNRQRQRTPEVQRLHIRWMIRRDIPAVLATEAQFAMCPMSELDVMDLIAGREHGALVCEDWTNGVGEEQMAGHLVYHFGGDKCLYIIALTARTDAAQDALLDRMRQKMQSGGKRAVHWYCHEEDRFGVEAAVRCGWKATETVRKDQPDDRDSWVFSVFNESFGRKKR